MNILIVLLSLTALSECIPNKDILPIKSTTTTTENYETAVIKDFIRNIEKLYPTQTEKQSQTNNETSSSNEEITDELIASVLKEPDSEAPSPASSDDENSPPSYLEKWPPTTTSNTPPKPVPGIIKPPVMNSLNKKIDLLDPSYDNLGGFSTQSSVSQYKLPSAQQEHNVPSAQLQRKVPSAQLQHKVPSAQLQHKVPSAKQKLESPPSFDYVLKNIPLPYNPSSFYDQEDRAQPVIPQKEYPYYLHSYIPQEMYPIHYQSFLMPQEQPQSSNLHQVHNIPLINYGRVPFAPMYANSNAYFGQPQYLPYLNQPPQSYGTLSHIVSYVPSHIPQEQFQPTQFNAPQGVSFQPSGYMPLQLSEEDIISLIRKFEDKYSSGAYSVSLNPPSIPVQSYSNQPKHGSVASNSEEDFKRLFPVKSPAPLPYYR
ncbi:unnamed protein product [Nezara viridula]|uniref:Neuropeptide n=1 Tax=Nezara viridula TaxID=85310 RepID=A0A9P0MPX8_NEZVI|nr:unnamed protein product [Nezara viridula]